MHKMTRDEAKDYIKQQLPEYLRGRRLPLDKNFKCLNPDHADKTPSMSYHKDRNKVHCFACGATYDMIDIIGIDFNISDVGEKFKKAYDLYSIEIEEDSRNASDTSSRSVDTATAPEAPTAPEQITDFNNFFLLANKDLDKTDYHRGISAETLNAYIVGYVENWRHPKHPNAPASPRLIIPITKYNYIARDTRSELTPDQEEYKKQKVKGKEKVSWIYNKQVLESADKPIMIVEGEIDALSIIDAGGEAVALGSTGNVGAFLEYIRTHKPVQPLVISLDQDEAGQKAEQKLIDGFLEQNISFYRWNVSGAYKDANDRLINDPEGLKKELAEIQKELPGILESAADQEKRKEAEAKKSALEEYRKENAASYALQSFIDGIAENANTEYIPTGFNSLDKALDGGLYEGLYIIGAISSLGKTTLVLQIADQIAQQNKDVLIISLEMSKFELMAKSISRLTFIECLNSGEDPKNAKTNRGITTGSRYANYTSKETSIIQKAMASYGDYAGHIFIYEGVGDIGADQIREKITKHKELTGKAPVVIVDYLQILAPANDKATDKQNTDKSVTELKRISRDYKTPVIAISALNRQSYKDKVTMESFKESGAIEYSSDILLGLQLQGIGESSFDLDKAKQKTPREIELTILKNRNGQSNIKVSFEYFTMFNYFQEAKQQPQTKNENKYT